MEVMEPRERSVTSWLTSQGMKQDPAVSPAVSYLSLQSDWSKDFPINFKGDISYPESGYSISSCCLSMKSHRSMAFPLNFKEVPSPHSSCELSSRLLSTVHVRCCVCSDILTDPVSIPCGHSYCKHCIDTYWSQPGPTGDYVCRQCEKSYPVRPELGVNVALTCLLQVLQQTGFTPRDVACDICSSYTRQAVKTCVTCRASYCEKHVRKHYTVPALQKHTLAGVNEDPRLSEREGNSGRLEEPTVDGESEEHQ